MTAAYDQLAGLAELELELVAGGSLEELPALHARRDALVAALPAVAPDAARPALERAAALQARVSTILAERLRETGTDLGRLTQGRSAVRGYAPAAPRSSLVDQAG